MSDTAARVTVLGGTGLLGYAAVRALRDRGATVRVVAREATPAVADRLPGLSGIPLHALDAFRCPDEALAELLTGSDALAYCLGPDDRTSPPAPAAGFYRTWLVNQTERVCRIAREVGVRRIVVLGSYFATWDRMHPELDIASRHPYVRARVEQAARAVAAGGGRVSGGADVCILEIPYVFGALPGVVPFWKEWLFEPLRAMPVALFPNGGTSVVTSRLVGEAVTAALLGPADRPGAQTWSHGRRFPLSDAQLTWPQLLRIALDAMQLTDRRIVTVPRMAAELGTWSLAARTRREGREAGLDPRWVMRDIICRRLWVDDTESRAALGYRGGGVAAAIAETVRAAYPPGASW